MKRTLTALASFCFLTQSVLATYHPHHHNKDYLRLKRQVDKLNHEVDYLKHKKAAKPLPPQPKASAHDFGHGITVTTSPLLGRRNAYNAADLMVNLPSMNEDLHLLEQRRLNEMRLLQSNQTLPQRPIVILSGQVTGQLIAQWPYNDNTSTNVDLNTAQIETLANVGTWATGFVSLNFDPSPAPSGSRIANSNVYLRRGFLTLGNLRCSPVYFTIGQMYVPFGRYASLMLSTPTTQAIARTNERTALLGYAHNGIYAETYLFNGDTDIGNSNIDAFGANVGYKYKWNKYSFESGVGYMTNIADADGMQETGAGGGSFQGFGQNSTTEQIRHRVPAVDLHTELTNGPYSLVGEYISTTRSFDRQNLSFNNHGAIPQALHVEGEYRFNISHCKKAAVALAYDRTWEALDLNQPEHSITGVFSTSLLRNTIETLEYRHDVNYSSSDTASGNGSPSNVNSVGGNQNTIMLQVGVYF